MPALNRALTGTSTEDLQQFYPLPIIYGNTGFGSDGRLDTQDVFGQMEPSENVTVLGVTSPYAPVSGLISQSYTPTTNLLDNYTAPVRMVAAKNVSRSIFLSESRDTKNDIASIAKAFNKFSCAGGGGDIKFEGNESDPIYSAKWAESMARIAAWKMSGYGSMQVYGGSGSQYDAYAQTLRQTFATNDKVPRSNGTFSSTKFGKHSWGLSVNAFLEAEGFDPGVPYEPRLELNFFDAIALYEFTPSEKPLLLQDRTPLGFLAYYAEQPTSAYRSSTGVFAPTSGCYDNYNSASLYPRFKLDCVKDTNFVTSGAFTSSPSQTASFARQLTWPTVWAPDERVPLFVNSLAPRSLCEGITSVVQALYMACHLQNNSMEYQLPEQPSVESVDDIPVLVGWLASLRTSAEQQTSRIYFESMPTAVVKQFQEGTVIAPASAGVFATQTAQLRGSLESLHGGWNTIASSLDVVMNAVSSVNLAIASANIEENKALNAIAMNRIQLQIQQASSIAQAQAACSPSVSVGQGLGVSFSPGACFAQSIFASVSLAKTKEIESILNSEGISADDAKSNQVATALNHLDTITNEENTKINDALIRIREGAAQSLAILTQLRSSEIDATYQLAKAAGADYAEFKDGTGQNIRVDFPVNTVLRRQYDITKRRYEVALRDARYMAYIARLAIEQRIGMRLSTISTPVGPFEAPSQWADEVCSLQGINYKQLRDSDYDSPGAGNNTPSSEVKTIENFADRFVGDYVTKLENFVEVYNITYPSHDGDDQIVLSLRDDLLGGATSCTAESANLLLYSSRLNQSDSIAQEDGSTAVRGWQQSHCTETRCLFVDPQATVPGRPVGPLGSGNAPYSWIHDIDPQDYTQYLDASSMEGTGGSVGTSGASGEGGVGGGGGTSGTGGSGGSSGSSGFGSTDGAPSQVVYQTVQLSPGNYLLSWWDQRRDTDGRCLHLLGDPTTPDEPNCVDLPTSDASAPYNITVYDSSWYPIKTFTFEPSIGQWSTRHESTLSINSAQKVHVAFQASQDGEHGSLLLSGIQLEALSSLGSGATPYIDTLSSRLYISSDCGASRTADDVQQSFAYRCTANEGCFYDLIAPFSLDTRVLAAGTSKLKGKIAAGNFNYRHVDMGVNLAGTGLINCEGVPGNSCYSNGFAEYTLDHAAFQAGILNYEGNQQYFSFGSAAINHGKGLAAERYITTPISSADQGFMSQPSVLKSELRGRPLDGTYRFRIWDQPGLQWNHLEDVQFVLKYRYWSPISKQQTSSN